MPPLDHHSLMLPVRAIELTRGLASIIDVADYDSVSQFTWYAQSGLHTFYGARRAGHSGPLVYLHTFITGYEQTDHVNGNGLDNRRFNLRSAHDGENQANNRRRSTNTSGHVGVTWDKSRGKWLAQIGGDNYVGRGSKYLGRYAEFCDAVTAYHYAAKERFGEFAPNCCDDKSELWK